jgi:hypothetical protein
MIDKRVVTRYIEKGLVSPALLEKHVNELPDSQSNAVVVEVEQEHADDDGSFSSQE